MVSALGLRLVAWFLTDPVTFDSAIYFEMAGLMREGRWSEALAYDYPPLYPLLIAGVQPLAGSAEAAGLLIALLADLLVFWPILMIARRAVGEDAAWAAAFLWAVHLSAIRFGVHALSDAPTVLCVVVAVAAGLRALDHARVEWALGAGAASGFAFLFRPEGLEPALALAVFYALTAQGAKRAAHGDQREAQSGQRSAVSGQLSALGALHLAQSGRGMRRLGWIVAPLAGWVLVAGPYVAYISTEAGTLTLSKKKSAVSFVQSAVPLVAAENPRNEAASRAQEQTDRSPTASWLRRGMHNLYVFQKPLVNGLTAVVIVPACIGLAGVLGWRRERWNPTLTLLGGLFLLHFAVLVGLAADKGATYLGRHHFLLMTLYALPVAGAGLASALGWMHDRLGGRGWLPSAALCLIVGATALALATRGPIQGRSLREAAAWIRTQVPGTPVLVTRLYKLTYHANAVRVDIAGAYEEIVRRAREHNADFVALYPNLIGYTSPDFLACLNSADLELVKVFPEPAPSVPEQRLELYRVRAKQDGAGPRNGHGS